METKKRTISITETTLRTIADCAALMEWTQTQDELGCTVAATCDGDVYIQLSGVTVPTAIAHLGDTVIWDGNRFSVETPNQ